MAFLDYNLERMRGISKSVSDIANRAAAEREAKKDRRYGAIQTGIGVYAQQSAAEKLATAKALEADKGRAFDWQAALKLAGERGEERDWQRGEGFEQTKELEKLRADSRAALAKLEASFRKDGDAGDFDIDEAFARVMSYAVIGRPGEEWSMSWQPKEWTQEEKDRMLEKIGQRINQYGEDGAAVRNMVDSYLEEFDYLFPEEAAEGVDAISGAAPYVPGGNPLDYYLKGFQRPQQVSPSPTAGDYWRRYMGKP